MHRDVCVFKAFGVEMEGVAVLHDEFPRAHDAETRPNLVPELGLNLIKVQRELLVALHFTADKIRDDFFVCGTETELARVSVVEAQQLWAVQVPASAFFPEFGWLHRGHEHFLRADGLEFFAHDGLHATDNPQPERHPSVDSGSEPSDQAGTQHQAMAGNFRVCRIFLERRQQEGGGSHRSSGVAGAYARRPAILRPGSAHMKERKTAGGQRCR